MLLTWRLSWLGPKSVSWARSGVLCAPKLSRSSALSLTCPLTALIGWSSGVMLLPVRRPLARALLSARATPPRAVMLRRGLPLFLP
eukprot:8755432-Pyramimonas_sp.AAC.1